MAGRRYKLSAMRATRCPSFEDGPPADARFAAIDFETADRGRDSACAVAVVTVADGQIAERFYQLIRPPRRDFEFSYLHGIEWRHVADQPVFAEVWPELERRLTAVDFVVAHNASFDYSVVRACCAEAGLAAPARPFECTVKLARRRWGIYPTKLPDVCGRLGIQLQHHHAASDAEACARIVLSALREGARPA